MKLLRFAFMLTLICVVVTACKDDDEENQIQTTFANLIANGSATETTTMLTLQFSQDITGLTVDDITLDAGTTGATKGELTAKGSGKYELAINTISTGGDITLNLSKTGYVITPDAKTVAIYYYKAPTDIDVTFDDLTPDGSATETTTMLTLQFSQDITGLTADDITLDAGTTGATKGELTAKGSGKYELAINTISTGGDITLNVSKTGYVITPGAKTATIYAYTYTPKVYVAGVDGRTATLWIDGVAQALSGGDRVVYAYDLAILNNDTYVTGYEDNGTNMVATLWKNNTVQRLADGTNNSSAQSIATSDNDIYICGDIEGTATVWKNGIPQSLTDGTNAATGYSITIVNNDVYVAGYERIDKSAATLWKNGTPQRLTDGINNSARAVTVAGNDVYVAGFESINDKNVATLWKNGTAQQLTDGTNAAVAQSVTVVGNDVYVAGYESIDGKNVATLWKNGTPQRLTDGTNAAQATVVVVQ